MKQQRSEFFRLEDRILFEAAAVGDMNSAEDMETIQNENDHGATQPPEDSISLPPESTAGDDAELHVLIEGKIAAGSEVLTRAELQNYENMALAVAESFGITTNSGRELVIINSSVAGVDKILDSLSANQDVLLLENGSDGMEQIQAYLVNRGGQYDAIHIVTHGNAGYFILNNQIVDAGSFDADAWGAVGDYLATDGDILIYGCNLAANEAGRELVGRIAEAAGADVSASDNTTGLGGDWTLEYEFGAIDTHSITVDDYEYRLNDWMVTVDTDSGTVGDLRHAVTNALSGDSIFFNLNGNAVITLHSELIITQDILTINGDNSGNTVTIQTNGGDFRLFCADNTSVDWNLTFQNIKLIGNSTAGTAIDGGALYIHGKSIQLTLDAVDISISQAKSGGAVYAEAENLEVFIENSYFESNTARNGGAIYATGAVTVNHSTFKSNTAKVTEIRQYARGGAIFATGKLILEGSSFDLNCAEAIAVESFAQGGAIYASGGLAVDDCSFDSNYADVGDNINAYAKGGAVYSTTGFKVIGSLFNQNRVLSGRSGGASGGAIAVETVEFSDTLTVSGCTFTGNATDTGVTLNTRYGGAIYYNQQNAVSGSLGTITIDDATVFDGNISNYYGGAIYATSVFDIRIDIRGTSGAEVVFKNNEAKSGGALMIETQGTAKTDLTLSYASFVNNQANIVGNIGTHGDGGAIFISRRLVGNGNTVYSVEIAIRNSLFENNYARHQGGAIAITHGNMKALEIHDSVFSGNVADVGVGGAVFVDRDGLKTTNGKMEVVGSYFYANRSNYDKGGAIYTQSSSLTVTGCQFGDPDDPAKGNRAISGGAIVLDPQGATAAFADVKFYGNIATQTLGGAVYLRGGGNFDNAVFVGNGVETSTANGFGGAIYAGNRIYLRQTCLFEDNYVKVTGNFTAAGGAVYSSTGVNIVGTTEMNGNDTSSSGGASYGGAIYCNGNSGNNILVLSAATAFFSGNSAGYGGAIYMTSTGTNTVSIINSTFTGNTAVVQGGAIWAGGRIALQIGRDGADYNVSFTGNTVDGVNDVSGGAVYASGGLTIINSSFQSNSATVAGAGTARGGAIFNDSGTFSITDSHFEENSARFGGAVFSNCGFEVSDSTFVKNHAASPGNDPVGGGAIAVDSTLQTSVTLTIMNCVFQMNEAITEYATNSIYGGAVCFMQNSASTAATGRLLIEGATTFEGNASGHYGGAIYAYSNFQLNVEVKGANADDQIIFRNNTARLGGALTANGNKGDITLSVEYALFDRNSAARPNGSGSSASGGAIHVLNPSYSSINKPFSNISLVYTDFTGNQAESYGGAVYVTHLGLQLFEINLCVFDGNTAGGDGGAINTAYGSDARANGTIIVKESQFYSNVSKSGSGGAIYARSYMEVYDSLFGSTDLTRGNSARYAGAVAAEAGYVDASSKKALFFRTGFYGNRATAGVAGAVQLRHAADFTDVIFRDNAIISDNLTYSTTGGGAIHAYGWVNLYGDCVFENNRVDLDGNYQNAGGGAIYSYTMVAIYGNAQFLYNYAACTGGSTYGGAIFCEGGGWRATTIIIRGKAEFTGNYADYGGAVAVAMSYHHSTISISGEAVFTGNRALNGDGGAIYLNARGEYGGILLTGGIDITGVTSFLNNEAVKGNGGAIYIDAEHSAEVDIAHTVFTGNRAGISGGAIYAGADLTLTHSEFRLNSATANGGGVYLAGQSALLENTLLADNLAGDSGGAIYLADAAVTAAFTNLTIANNTALNGGGIYTAGKNVLLRNSILWGNTGNQYTGLDNFKVYNSAIQGWAYNDYRTQGNVNLQASNAGARGGAFNDNTSGKYYVCFRNAENIDRGARDYRLNTGSYAINRGDNIYVDPADTDLAGNARIYNAGNGGRADMGAYESGNKGQVVISGEEIDVIYGFGADLSFGQDGYGGGDINATGGGSPYVLMINGKVIALRAGGTVQVTARYEGDDNWNEAEGAITVTTLKRSIVIGSQGGHYTYDGSWRFFSWDGLIGGLGLAAGDVIDDFNTMVYRDAGTYAGSLLDALILNASGEDMSENYDITYTQAVITIDKAVLTITGESGRQTYDGKYHDYGWIRQAGLVDGDWISSYSGGRFRNAGTYLNILSGALILNTDGEDMSGNYLISYESGTVVIDKAKLTIVRDGNDKVYDGTTAGSYEASMRGLFDGDDVIYTKGEAAFSDRHAGVNKALSYMGGRIGGEDLGNYEIEYIDFGADILRAELTIVIDDQTKYRGTADPEFTGQAEGLVEGDHMGGYYRTDQGEEPGAYDIDGFLIEDGNGGRNYQVTVEKGTLKIIDSPIINHAEGLNIYQDAASHQYAANGLQQFHLMRHTAFLTANRETDAVTDTETDGNYHSFVYQTRDKIQSRLKTDLKETSLKTSFEKSVEREACQVISVPQAPLHLITDFIGEAALSGYIVMDPDSAFPLRTATGYPVETDAGPIAGFPFADIPSMDKADRFKDSFEVALEELMII